MRLFLLSALLILPALGLLFVWMPREGEGGNGEQQAFAADYLAYQQELVSALESQGNEAAREHFQSAYEGASSRHLFHELAHWLGAQYYLREGKGGVQFCDETAGFGCFHGFYGMAFAREGGQFFEDAEEFCGRQKQRVAFAECIHGIGHGILAGGGYEASRLPEALDACGRLKLDSFHERLCTSGVFMEYNIRSLEFDSGVSPLRSFDERRPYEPCPRLAASYQPICYHDLPYWWVPALGEDAEMLGVLCQDVRGPENRKSCFQGLGKIMPWMTQYQKEEIAQRCLQMPDAASQALCLEEALFVLLYKGEENPTELCELAGPDQSRECKEKGETFRCEMLEMCE